MSPGADGKTKISFVWSPTPAVPGCATRSAATVSLLAGSANPILYYRGKRGARPRGIRGAARPVELEIAVQDAAGEVLDRETRKIVVPGLGLGLTLSTPEVFRGRTLPEWQSLAADPRALPAIEREFRRTDRLLIRVGAQSAGGTPDYGAYAEP